MSLILSIGMLIVFPAPEASSIAKADVRIFHFAILDVSEEKNLLRHTVAAQLRLMGLDPRTLSPDTPRFGDAVSLVASNDFSDRERMYSLACSEEQAQAGKLKAEIYSEALRRVREAARVVAKRMATVLSFCVFPTASISILKTGMLRRICVDLSSQRWHSWICILQFSAHIL